ncbi:MAG: vWA domain-containing protein [Pseudomonadota bacterium]
MNTKLIALVLFTLTFGAFAYYPTLDAKTVVVDPLDPLDSVEVPLNANGQPVIDVVFVLDTTGSMSGLIQTAKEKIWSIASTMAAAQPTPEIRIGLVGYRDRGDAYVTRKVDLSGDLDSVYAALMDFQADGGGDTPESVNAALEVAVNSMSWSEQDQAYQVIFLVGDAPPHMDYQDEMQYPAIVAAARERGIVVNAIQCGAMSVTAEPWAQIAALGQGSFFQVEQAGSAVAYTTPFDTELADLSARLDATRLYYGSEEDKEAAAAKLAATEKLSALASDEAKARRAAFNLSAAGEINRLGENELVDAVTKGEVRLEELSASALPAAIAAMSPAEQSAHVAQLADERAELQGRMRALAESRDAFIRQKVEEEGGAADSLDQKLYDAIADQAKHVGLDYDDGPSY